MIYKTDKVFLGPLTKEILDKGNYKYWINDPTINEFNSHAVFPITEKEIDEYIESINTNMNVSWAIFPMESLHSHIGNIALQEIDSINRSAELAIIIGDEHFWGKGIATDACQLVLSHAFDKLNLKRVWLGTAELNEGMIKVAKKIGMEPEGRLVDAFWYKDRYIDIVRYSIIRKK